MINTEKELTLINDEIVKLTLNFELLLRIKNKYPDEYEEFGKFVLFGQNNKDADFFDIVQVIYTAYLCANIEDREKLTKEEFIKLLPFDITMITRLQQELLGFKKK